MYINHMNTVSTPPTIMHHQASTIPDSFTCDCLIILLALTPMITETKDRIPHNGGSVNIKPYESSLLILICLFKWGVIELLNTIQKLKHPCQSVVSALIRDDLW
jgi:hypothetical protein